MDKNGLNRENIYVPRPNEAITGNVYTDGENLYFMLKTTDKINIKDKYSIVRVNSLSKEFNVIYSFPSSVFPPSIDGAAKNNLIITLFSHDPKNNNEFINNLYYFDVMNEKMANAPFQTFASSKIRHEIYNDEILVIDPSQNTISLQNLVNGTELIADYSAIYTTANVNKDFIPYIFKINQNLYRFEFSPAQTDGIWLEYLYDTKLKTVIPFTLENKYRESAINILAEFEDTYLTISDYTKKMIDVGDSVVETYYPQYAFISKEDFSKSIDNYSLVESVDY